MGSLFDINGKFFQKVMRAADLVLLNLLTLLCCLPVVTIGPAVCAMHYVLLRDLRNEEGGLLRDFFRSFRQNLKQGIALTVGYLFFFLILAADYALAMHTQRWILTLVLYALPFLALLGCLSLCWAFVLLSRYQMTLWQTVKTTFAATIAHPIRSLAMTALMVLPFLLLVLTPLAVPVFLFFGLTLCGLLRARLYAPVLTALETPPDTTDI